MDYEFICEKVMVSGWELVTSLALYTWEGAVREREMVAFYLYGECICGNAS